MKDVVTLSNKKRIEFIDLAKGVCILLVVLSHSHVNIPYLQFIRMPLYFILSGLFFKLYDGFVDFSVRKINKIIIPFLFFYIISFGLYLLIRHFLPDVQINSEVDEFYFLDPLFSRLCFNNPLWFLISLFTVNIIFYIFLSCYKHIVFQSIVAILSAFGSYFIHKYQLNVPLYLEKTLYFYPFFFFGYYLKRTNLLVDNHQGNHETYLTISLIILGIFVFWLPIPSNIRYYIVGLSWVVALLLLLKKIKYVPFISYFGRYSIIILCTSYLVYSPLQVITRKLVNLSDLNNNLIVFGLTVLIEFFVIKFCLKYLPHFTAQKDLISYNRKKYEKCLNS